ncbi:hypothetical protein ACMGDM_20080 [Sphingomonas sp. DT-51]|uniref:hypothetical protein n=1 Tax=Sphingomonas sp. DT-51 TaxID=3396165 RepID=UPI003F1CE284
MGVTTTMPPLVGGGVGVLEPGREVGVADGVGAAFVGDAAGAGVGVTITMSPPPVPPVAGVVVGPELAGETTGVGDGVGVAGTTTTGAGAAAELPPPPPPPPQPASARHAQAVSKDVRRRALVTPAPPEFNDLDVAR